MSSNVTILNSSDRIFVLAGNVELAPKGTAEVDSATADRLFEMYPGELVEAPLAPAPRQTSAKPQTAAQKKAAEDTRKSSDKAATSSAAEAAKVLASGADAVEGVVYLQDGVYSIGHPLTDGKIGLLEVSQLTADEQASLVDEGKLPSTAVTA